MKLDLGLSVDEAALPGIATLARAAEEIGFAGIWAPETKHNPFFPLILAAEHSKQIQLGTAVAIAFPRSPMVMAQLAWDLQAYSGGRFLLGLGTQVQAHIERRFSATWDQPVARLRDYIKALRAIWQAFQTDGRLVYRGQYYTHTLLLPFFNPGPIEHPHIPIYIAGVNTGLAKLAGELCEGFHVHPLHSVRQLREQLRPAIAAAATAAGRDPAAVQLAASVMVVTGRSSDEREQLREAMRRQIAFYASTPTYRSVLELHGWEEIGAELSRLSAMKRWDAMPGLVSDEMLQVFAVEAAPDQLAAALRERYTGLLDRVFLYQPFIPGQNDDFWRSLAYELARG